MSTSSQACPAHGLMMPMPDAGGACWYCARDQDSAAALGDRDLKTRLDAMTERLAFPAAEHEFTQDPDAEAVHACLCGRWPEHHLHTGDKTTCTCDACKETQ